MKFSWTRICMVLLMISCVSKENSNNGNMAFSGEEGEVKLIVFAPGHFHASLLQKESLPQVNDSVFVYAPDGPETDQYLKNIEQYNSRKENPTSWNVNLYQDDDFLSRMLSEKKGNVVVLSGKNQDKTEYILGSVKNGLNVLCDKPMAINQNDFKLLEQAYTHAEANDVILYDMMTERYDLLNMIEKELINDPDLFGLLDEGSRENPAIVMNSGHHFYKDVSGVPTIRPAWYYDVEQQGEGIVDVTTHLIDLVHWKCFPDMVINYQNDIRLTDAERWPTEISLEEFTKSTGENSFPDYLNKYLVEDKLHVFANGIIRYTVKNANVELRVNWDFYGPNQGADTYSSVVRGTKASTLMLQGEEQDFSRQLFVRKGDNVNHDEFIGNLQKAMADLQVKYPFISYRQTEDDASLYLIDIPADNRTGHESHFKTVAESYFGFLVKRNLPEWEKPNTITKYYITTKALEIAQSK